MVPKLIALGCVALPCLAAAGPKGTLYLTTGSDNFLLAVHGPDQTFFNAAIGGEGPIAVSGAVKTTGIQTGAYGSSYALDGTATGGFYLNDVPSSSLDATTDGALNYVVNVDGDVYAAGADFDLPVQIFSTLAPSGGIAFDPISDSLWIDTDGSLTQYSTTGDVLGGFALAQGGYTAVAFDRTDGTLWTGTNLLGDTFLSQYTTSGNLLQSYFLGAGVSVSGMEFDVAAVPEPASLLALGLGALPLLMRRRFRNDR